MPEKTELLEKYGNAALESVVDVTLTGDDIRVIVNLMELGSGTYDYSYAVEQEPTLKDRVQATYDKLISIANDIDADVAAGFTDDELEQIGIDYEAYLSERDAEVGEETLEDSLAGIFGEEIIDLPSLPGD